jgi:hypothetical protein
MPHLIGDYSSKNGTKGLDAKRIVTGTETSRGFVELGEGGAGRRRSNGNMELGDMYKSSGKTGAVNTNITSGKYGSNYDMTPNSSEEMVSRFLNITGGT